jgi:hypothetical protein
MRNFFGLAAIVSLVLLPESGAWANEEIVVKREAAERFATLPDGARFPEGITVNPKTEEIYVATFDFGPNSNKLLRFKKNGQLIAQRDFGGTPLLGIQFNASDKKIYIGNVGALVGGASKIQRMAADFNDTTPIEDVAFVPRVGAPPNRTEDNRTAVTTRSSLATMRPLPTLWSLTRAATFTFRIPFKERFFALVMSGLAQRPALLRLSNMTVSWRRPASLLLAQMALR